MCDSPFVLTPQAVWIACNHAVNYVLETGIKVSIPQAVLIACNFKEVTVPSKPLACFNTASGMDCMQYRFTLNSLICFLSFNTASGMDCMQFEVQFCRGRGSWFQYRKRYGLHAIPSLTALGTAEPRSGFSKRSALFGKPPQPRGIFLSPKSAENVRKPCDTKETFVHGKNLKLMAFSREFLPSL